MTNQKPGDLEFYDEGISLREIFRTLLRYRLLMGVVILFAFLVGSGYLFLTKPVYQASGEILVETSNSSLLSDKIRHEYDEQVPVITINDVMIKLRGSGITDSVIVKTAAFVTIGIPSQYSRKLNYFSAVPPRTPMRFTVVPSTGVRSEYRVFSSRGVLIGTGVYGKRFNTPYFSMILSELKPVKSFLIDLEPVTNLRGAMLNRIKASNLRDSNVIRLSYSSSDPIRAKTVVNTYLNEIAYQDLLEKREKATTLRLFLEDQYRTVSSSIERAENIYLSSRMSTGIISLDEQTKQYIDFMRFLEEKRIDYEIRLEEATASREKAAAILKGDSEFKNYSQYASSPFIQTNTILQELYSKIATLQVDNAKLKSQFNASHPQVLQSNAELEAARKQLDEAISSTVSNATKGVDPLLRPIVESQLSNGINVHVYQQLLSRIKTEIAGLNTTLGRLPRSEIEKARYERSIGINNHIHDLLLTRLEEARILEASTVSDVRVINWAEVPNSPVAPRKQLVLSLSLLAGLLGSCFLIFGIEHFRPSFGTADSVESSLEAPVLALIPRIPSNGNGRRERLILVNPEIKSYYGQFNMYEVYNSLLVNLLSSEYWKDQKVLVVTSTFAGEGKSMVSANLAVMAARSGRKVLLIDSDFRGPVQHTMFGVPNSNGFAELIKTNSSRGFVKTPYPNLIFLPSGNTGGSMISELFHDPNLEESITKLESGFDLIIIDSPPLMLYSDAVALSSRFRNVLLVIKSSTEGEAVLQSKKVLRKVNARIIGTVINDVRRSLLFGSSYREYEYGYGYAKDEQKAVIS